MRWWFIALVALGCASEPNEVENEESSGNVSLDTRDTEADGQLAQQGEVCRSGGENPESIQRGCAEGFNCCYPCGMEGCDYVCATPQECESWSTLP